MPSKHSKDTIATGVGFLNRVDPRTRYLTTLYYLVSEHVIYHISLIRHRSQNNCHHSVLIKPHENLGSEHYL